MKKKPKKRRPGDGKRGPRKGEGGVPKKQIDIKMFENLCGIGCTIGEVADAFDIDENTLSARIKEHYGKTFSVVFKQKRSMGKRSLRRVRYQKAIEDKDNTMIIWLSKQLLGEKDQQHIASESTIKTMELKITNETPSLEPRDTTDRD